MIPIGDSPRSRTTPWMTRALILSNVVVFLLMLTLSTALPATRAQANREFQAQSQGVCYGFAARPTETDRFYCRWGFQTKEWLDSVRNRSRTPSQGRLEVILTVLTSVFIHAGWLHIAGNMIFLWVFGDNVEDRLGHFGFLLFYLLCGFVASMTQSFINVDSLTPTVGASGAVAGVLGAYLVYYPKARVTTLIPITIILIPIPIPAVIMIGVWFLQNLLSGLGTLGTVGAADSGVAFFAHIGGFVFGALLILLFFRHARPDRRRRA